MHSWISTELLLTAAGIGGVPPALECCLTAFVSEWKVLFSSLAVLACTSLGNRAFSTPRRLQLKLADGRV